MPRPRPAPFTVGVARGVQPWIRLDANENPYGPSKAARAALRATVETGNRYTDAFDELVAAIAARHRVGPEHVVVGAGSFMLLGVAAASTLQRGGNVVLATPTFDPVAQYAEALGASSVRVPLDRTAAHDLDAMSAAITGDTRLVYVCNPNNPTGTIALASDLRAFCRRHADRVRVLVDEAYHDYVDDPRHASMDALVRDGVPIIVLRTFSKLFGLAGLRVGYAIAPPAVAAALRRTRGGPDKAWISAPGAVAALASIGDASFVAAVRRDNASVRTQFVAALRRLGLDVPASHANFVYFRHRDSEAVSASLARRGIRISDMPGACRITIGVADEMTATEAALPGAL